MPFFSATQMVISIIFRPSTLQLKVVLTPENTTRMCKSEPANERSRKRCVTFTECLDKSGTTTKESVLRRSAQSSLRVCGPAGKNYPREDASMQAVRCGNLHQRNRPGRRFFHSCRHHPPRRD